MNKNIFLSKTSTFYRALDVPKPLQIIFMKTQNETRALAGRSAVRFQTLPLRLQGSIFSAAVDFASACIYLCL